jgi:hypothetical protein
MDGGEMDERTRQVVLVALLRAVSDLKSILNAQERGASRTSGALDAWPGNARP